MTIGRVFVGKLRRSRRCRSVGGNVNLPLTETDCHARSLSMDNSTRPDMKRKLVVVGDGSFAPHLI